MRPGRCPVSPVGPRQRGAERVGRVGGGEGHGHGLGVGGLLGERAQPVDGTGGPELGGAEALDEVAAPAAAGVLEGGEHLVDRGETAGHALADDGSAGDHAVPVEQPLGDGVRPSGGVGVDLGQHRPAARGLRWSAADGHPPPAAEARAGRSASRAMGGTAGPRQGPERGEGVVADPSGPHQVPERAGQGGVPHRGVGRARHGVGQLAEEPRPAGGQRRPAPRRGGPTGRAARGAAG